MISIDESLLSLLTNPFVLLMLLTAILIIAFKSPGKAVANAILIPGTIAVFLPTYQEFGILESIWNPPMTIIDIVAIIIPLSFLTLGFLYINKQSKR